MNKEKKLELIEEPVTLFDQVKELIDRIEKERDELSKKYYDLLFQVCNKIPGETRHETAKRIIFEHENCQMDVFEDAKVTK